MTNDATVAEKRDPLLGTLFDGRFRIQFRLAAGGYGAIYSAVEVSSRAEVALKVLHSNLTLDKSCVKRFRREGALLRKLEDPHTLGAFELGEAPDGTLYIVMELLHGETLHDRIRKSGPLPWQKTIEITRAICSSLGEAHGAGIVHRDLKPSNIFLQDRDGHDFVKVLDFGIAKILRGNEHATQLTVAGRIIGTVEYMSPEQLQGELCTARSDMYALGVVMYEMLAGNRPYAVNDPASLLAAMLHGPPARPVADTPIPAELERIVMRCLALEPQGRYRDVASLAAALARVNVAEKRDQTTHAHPDEAPTWFDPRARPSSPPVAAPQAPPAPSAAPQPRPAPVDVEGRTVRAAIPPPPLVPPVAPPPAPSPAADVPATPRSRQRRLESRAVAAEAWKRTALGIIIVASLAILAMLIAMRRH